MKVFSRFLLLGALVFSVTGLDAQNPEERTFNLNDGSSYLNDGSSFEAKAIYMKDDEFIIYAPDTASRWYEAPITAFSADDQAFLNEWVGSRTMTGNPEGKIDLFSDLVLALFMNGGLEDSSGLAQNGKTSLGTFVSDRFERENNALSLPGLPPENPSDFRAGVAVVPPSPELDFMAPATYSFWYYRPSVAHRAGEYYENANGNQKGGGILCRWGRGGLNGDNFLFGLGHSERDQLTWALPVPGYCWISAKGQSRKDEWIHVVGTFDGSNARLYVDSELNQSLPVVISDRISFNRPIKLGVDDTWANSSNRWLHYSGLIDDVLIYRRTFNEAEVKALFEWGEKIETGILEKDPKGLISFSGGRTWTGKNGKELIASFQEVNEDGIVTLELEDGTMLETAMDQLSDADQYFLEKAAGSDAGGL